MSAAEPPRLITDDLRDKNVNVAEGYMGHMKFKTDFMPVPRGVTVQYWARVYNRADSAAYKKSSRKMRVRERQSGKTWDDALQLVINDVEDAIANADNDPNAKQQALLLTKANWGGDEDFQKSLTDHGVDTQLELW